MNSTRRIKFIIGLAILIVIALIAVVVFQLITLNKTKKELLQQQQQIERLQQEVDYYSNKQPNADYDSITGD